MFVHTYMKEKKECNLYRWPNATARNKKRNQPNITSENCQGLSNPGSTMRGENTALRRRKNKRSVC